MTFDPVAFEPAARRFRAFFDELRGAFVERDDVLTQIALALLAREHVLLAGPPGTAKSQLATAVFGRIVDEQTGRPSVYARQIGESTVRTDLVGPIDFKTLMETGRSEHFTDEGMLGAVHAFLDEVFDGRDMLLRDALNVLQERELKQGNKVVTGRIECALMTSNRYLSEVLEGSRETLLAFVDRIAFAGFVPRGFASERALTSVLRHHVGRRGGLSLVAPLSIQDLDVLQAACEQVTIRDDLCDRLAQLLRRFDAELLDATRADPTFVPTRYLSTRTAVRAGKLLRAIVVFRRIFETPGRAPIARYDDLPFLRLHLLLSGPTPESVVQLLAVERDPRERRQLEIIQTERLLFDRCFATLPPGDPIEATTPTIDPRHDGTLRQIEIGLGSRARVDVVNGAKRTLALLREGRLTEADAGPLLDRARAALTAHSLGAALAPTDASRTSVDALVDDLASLADVIDDEAPFARPIARWLRGRAIALLDESSHFAPAPGVRSATLVGGPLRSAGERARDVLAALVDRAGRREALRARGAEPLGSTSEAFVATVRAAEDEIVALWDEAVCGRLVDARLDGADALDRALDALAPVLAELGRTESTLASLGGSGTTRARVLAPRIAHVVRTALRRSRIESGAEAFTAIASVQATLERAGLGDALPPESWVLWATEAILASDEPKPEEQALPADAEGYERLRRAQRKTSTCYALAEVVLRCDPILVRGRAMPAAAQARIVEVLATLPLEMQRRLVARDQARIGAVLAHFERWWARVATDENAPEVVIDERFFQTIWDEGALLRFALEARTVAALFPSQAQEIGPLLARCEAVHRRARDRVDQTLRRRADAAWERAFPERREA